MFQNDTDQEDLRADIKDDPPSFSKNLESPIHKDNYESLV